MRLTQERLRNLVASDILLLYAQYTVHKSSEIFIQGMKGLGEQAKTWFVNGVERRLSDYKGNLPLLKKDAYMSRNGTANIELCNR